MAINNYIISVGSNSNDREVQIKDVLNWLALLFEEMKSSSTYNTAAINGKDSDYLNAIISGNSDLDFDQLNTKFKHYESLSGRNEKSNANGSIPIDIDIVIYNNEIIRERDFKQSFFQIGWQQIII